MALFIGGHDAARITAAGRAWVQTCLVGDGSILGDEPISTAVGFDHLDRYFVQQPEAGSRSFYEKLQAQLEDAPPSARKLMAEVLWALFLFPSNINAETKREGVIGVWNWSGETLAPDHPMLSDAMLEGIGSAGMGVNTNRWRELNFMIGLGQAVKKVSPAERAALFDDYDRHVAWMDTVPQDGSRQFRHMLRYFLFPDRVERMSSNGDRHKVLAAFGVAPLKQTRSWSDRQLDDALLRLRRAQEQRYNTTELDFYLDPLRAQWLEPNAPEGEPEQDDGVAAAVKEPLETYGRKARPARNLILYGPPGTGKTWRLQQLFAQYTDQPADVDRATWELQLVARSGWRAVIAAALADLGQPVKVAALEQHGLVKAKSAQRKRSNVRPTLWGYMQSHTPLEVTTVNVADRRPPYVFTKTEDADWTLVPEWRDVDPDAADLLDAWRAGPGVAGQPIQRYRVVTFHPSYSYEDFVVGLRPVAGESEGAAAGFRMVDGVFKQICAEAKANPSRQYALFIDEINRANIAKVFGELITLIEPDKRTRYDATGTLAGGIEVQLPGTGGESEEDERFGVPENLDIYGTMNTADRSIALLDIALRRRFEFEEIPPNYQRLDRSVEGVHLGHLLRAINDRIEFFVDRDRSIGHAYFMRVATLEELRTSFRLQIIPLLQEYFFDDWSRIEAVLSSRRGGSPFIGIQALRANDLFGTREVGAAEHLRYFTTEPDGWSAAAFRSIYETDDGGG